ncbi:predicted protein [Plenodomus lingam JN3]|uniref:Predicted protein n=1 Tax=Leptosphaeria maculans (strain JN3 / isolate v23.1.3 / race Av1-4-5-6-7-8) TaxID=985895 RepID=E5AE51_LEPMJ|nr:predicted protein [Plenodomus lingam JN3]CBY01490.1 predicted protein [Plenodomus lingam JN3]
MAPFARKYFLKVQTKAATGSRHGDRFNCKRLILNRVVRLINEMREIKIQSLRDCTHSFKDGAWCEFLAFLRYIVPYLCTSSRLHPAWLALAHALRSRQRPKELSTADTLESMSRLPMHKTGDASSVYDNGTRTSSPCPY